MQFLDKFEQFRTAFARLAGFDDGGGGIRRGDDHGLLRHGEAIVVLGHRANVLLGVIVVATTLLTCGLYSFRHGTPSSQPVGPLLGRIA